MRIALVSSKRERCGIATYTSYLEAALRDRGADVRHWGTSGGWDTAFAGAASWNPDVLHVQYERAIMPPDESMAAVVADFRGRRAATVVTLHSETPESSAMARRAAFDGVIVHRPGSMLAAVFPMPCPVYDPAPRNRIRARYGLPSSAIIVSTIGFLVPWKAMAETAEELAPWLEREPRAIVQLIASAHFNPDLKKFSEESARRLAALSSEFGGRVIHVAHYPPDGEVLDRLAASDVGYAYCSVDTGSSSAAASLFVSARCPVVASDSTHFEHLPGSVFRVPKANLSALAQAVETVARDATMAADMRRGMDAEYMRTNYSEFARSHLEFYESIL